MSLITKAFNYFGYDISPVKEEVHDDSLKTNTDNPINRRTEPGGRVSSPDEGWPTSFGGNINKFLKPECYLDYIPKIRHLAKTNEDVGSVYNDLIQLTNTGHQIKFDQSISSELADKMRKHINAKKETWGSGIHGIDGLVNKWIAQIWVSGALSTEWVPQRDLKGITNNVLVNPEVIRWKYNFATTRYEPYQQVKSIITKDGTNLVKLNTNTYFYSGILEDTDSPYGVPPFLTAIDALSNQKDMKRNIKHILRQLGLMGYLEVKLEKPDMDAGESLPAYKARLDKFLIDSKKNVTEGFIDGVVVGYGDDHEFEFHSTTKNIGGVGDLYNGNEVAIANGLKVSPSFLGQKSGGTETNMSIVFTKMLSQLKNVQQLVAANLKFGYLLELQLAGFNVKSTDFSIEFAASTITDDLKTWQAKEIKQRVIKAMFIDGIIGKDEYAELMGYNKPYKTEPVIPYADQAGKAAKPEDAKGKRNEVKKKSDRKGRDKKKEQPRRKDGDTKPR